jgi:hypothetical protein
MITRLGFKDLAEYEEYISHLYLKKHYSGTDIARYHAEHGFPMTRRQALRKLYQLGCRKTKEQALEDLRIKRSLKNDWR